MSKGINEDITSTLNKLICLLEYSTKEQADEVLRLLIEARETWNNDVLSEIEEG
jgi:hypothetical protein